LTDGDKKGKRAKECSLEKAMTASNAEHEFMRREKDRG